MRSEWNLHYAGWVIEDGQPDRSIGEIFDWFAITFWTEECLAKVNERSRSAVGVGDYRYRVVAEVTYTSDRACIIDFGLKATASSDRLPPECAPGDYVTGEVYLNLPLCTEVGPEEIFKTLAHRWQVNKISADLTPYVPHPHNPRHFLRDPSQIRYEELASTDSVKTHSYVLHCSEIVPE